MDGYFTKILYSNEYLTTIGIYLTVEFQGASIHLVNNKNILYFEKKVSIIIYVKRYVK